MRYGTSYFVSLDFAILYYRPYGYDRQGVKQKINAGEIHIGKPVLKPGETLSVIPDEGRYQAETREVTE